MKGQSGLSSDAADTIHQASEAIGMHAAMAVSQQTSQSTQASSCYVAEAAEFRRGNPYVECPYSHARFQPACKGQISPVGEIARIGADASGLMCSNTQR